MIQSEPDEEAAWAVNVSEEFIGKYYAVSWPKSYYWGKLKKVFANDAEDDADKAEFQFLQNKQPSAHYAKFRYD